MIHYFFRDLSYFDGKSVINYHIVLLLMNFLNAIYDICNANQADTIMSRRR